MEEKKPSNFEDMFFGSDSAFWLEPEKHALVKELNGSGIYYSIFTIRPVLMFKLCDDFDYCLALASKMLQHGVKVFDSFEDFLKEHNWAV